MRWTTAFIAACWLLGASTAHGITAQEAAKHRRLDDASCVRCHPAARGVLTGAMGTRAGEHAFAHRALGAQGEKFFAGSCGGCHVTRCSDCHGSGATFTAKPADDACLRCHRGYWTGWDYHGRAPREDHERYQRGDSANGERILKMIPDLHLQLGLTCANCHSMRSLQDGRVPAKTCRDCHPRPSPRVPEHAITAHLAKMECWACHSAWAPQEYGTFLVRADTPERQEAFAPLPAWGAWRKSAYLKRQDAPPLGLDARGLVSPIRPEFILFATDPGRGWDNRLLAAEWRAYFPHTTRRGTTTCSGCHDTPRRFLLESDSDRVYRPDEDGLALRSFWSRDGQTLRNGSFFPPQRYREMNRKSPTYVREHLKQWQHILRRVAPSSAR